MTTIVFFATSVLSQYTLSSLLLNPYLALIPTTIDRILHDHIIESARIEFKESWNPTPILHTICAFANDIDNWGGGYLVVGIKEDHGQAILPVSGIPAESIDHISKELLILCNFIEPRYIPLCEPVLYENKQLLLIWAPGGYSRPYKCPIDPFDKKGTKAYYIRKLSSTIKANAADVQELHSLTNNIPFDDRINGSCCHEFLKRARELNPDFRFLEEVSALYRRTAEMWGGDNRRNDADSLENLGGGFNVTLAALQDKVKRGRIAAKIRECADVTDEILRVLNAGLKA